MRSYFYRNMLKNSNIEVIKESNSIDFLLYEADF